MKRWKRAIAALVAILMMVISLAGCSTPAVAMTVDGREYATGEYLAYLYNSYYTYYQNSYMMQYYAYYGQDYWSAIKEVYGDDKVEMSLEDYLIQITKDEIIYQKALENKMKEFNIGYDEEKLKEFNETAKSIKNNSMLALGINDEHYLSMIKAVSLNEYSLFYNLYDNGGPRAMTEEEILKYYQENFLSYKIIELSLVDSNNADLSKDKADALRKELQGFLDEFNATDKTSKDFDLIIEKFNKAQSDKTSTTKPSTTGNGQSAAAPSTTTTTTTTATTTTTTATDTTTSTTGSATTDKEDPEKPETVTDPNRVDVDANNADDEDLMNAIKSVNVGEAKLVEYKKTGAYNTAAVILRLDPAADRGEGVDYFKDNRNNIIAGAHYEDFQKEIKDYANTLTVTYNNRAIRMCTPKKLEEDAMA